MNGVEVVEEVKREVGCVLFGIIIFNSSWEHRIRIAFASVPFRCIVFFLFFLFFDLLCPPPGVVLTDGILLLLEHGGLYFLWICTR